MHKQQKRVPGHLQAFWIAVGFSGKSCKIVTQQPIHALDGVGVRFASDMFCWGDNFVCMPMISRIKLGINMTNFTRKFLEIFCFSSANLKANKPLCGAVYRGPEPDIFLFIHNS